MEKKISGCLINITVHPHSKKDIYISLFEDIYNLDRAVRVHGDRYAWMSHLWSNTSSRGKKFLTGNIATFTRIDVDGSWIDMSTREAADEKRLKAVKAAVDGVQPNYHEFRFYFDPTSHQIVVEENDGKKSLSPSMSERFFREVCAASFIQETYGEVEVHVVPEKEAVSRIISSKYLRSIKIHITRPNPDSLAELEKELLDQLEDIGARTSEINYSAARGKTLRLDERTKRIARVARKNGFVEGNVGGEKLSTKDHPMIKVMQYEQKSQSQ